MNLGINKNTGDKQPIIALTILWIGGIILFGYLFFFIDNSIAAVSSFDIESNNPLSYSQKKDENDKNKKLADTATTANDAFVFVNFNKKHFLTRFVSTVPEINLHDSIKKDTTASGSSGVERVFKVIKINPVKKSSDFSIKTAPEL